MNTDSRHKKKIRVFMVLTPAFALLGAYLLTTSDPALGVLLLILSATAGAYWLMWARAAKQPAAEPVISVTPSASGTGIQTAAEPVNPYMRVMLFGGIGAAVAGAITAMSGVAASQSATESNMMLMALGGLKYFDPDAGAAGMNWMWFGIALLIVGVVLLIALLTIKAAKAK